MSDIDSVLNKTDHKKGTSTYIGPLTDAILDNIIKEIKKKHNKEKIMKNIIDPLLCDLTTRYYPHFLTVTIILIIMVVLLIAILIISIIHKQ